MIKLRISNFAWLSVFFGVMTTLLNYMFGASDHLEQLPIIYRTIDSNYLINDFFVNSNSDFSPRFYYAHLIGLLSNIMSIPWLFFIGTLFSNIGVSVLTYLSGKGLFQSKKTGLIAAALIMVLPIVELGGDLVLYASFFTPTTLVFPLILWSFYLFLRGRILYCLIIAGIASLFHVLIGLEYGCLFLTMYIIIEFTQHQDFKKAIKLCGLFLVPLIFSLPNLIPHFQNASSINPEAFIEILAYFRHPHHYVLSDILTTKELIKALLILVIIALTYKDFKNGIQTTYHQKSTQILALFLGLVVISNWVFVELIPLKLFTALQPLRLLNIGKWIFILMIANHFIKSLEKGNLNPKTIIIVSLYGLLIFMDHISWIKVLLIAMIYFSALFLLFKKYTKAVLIYCFVVTGLILSIQFMNSPELKPLQKTYLSSDFMTENQSLLSEYIQLNTDEESLFMAPHLFGFLRTETERAIVVDYKAFPFSETAMLEWYTRIKNCYGLDKKNFEKHYKNLSDEEIQSLKEKYHFDYAVLYVETQTKMPVIYANSAYKIIDLTDYAQ